MSEGSTPSQRGGGEKLAARIDGEQLLAEIGIDDEEIEWRKRFVDFDEGDVRRLEGMGTALDDVKDEAVEEFYEHLQRHEETREVLGRSTRTVEQLKESQADYLVTLAGGTYDDEYFADRARIGKIHDMLEMPMKQYIGTYMLYYNILVPRLGERIIERTCDRLDGGEGVVAREFRRGIEEILSLLRITNLDLQVATDTYVQSYSRRLSDELRRRQRASATIRTSLAELSDRSDAVTGHVQEIATLTDGQSETSRNVSQEVANLSASIEEVAASTDQVRQTSTQAEDLASSGLDAAEAAIETMRELDEARGTVSDNVEGLQEMIQEIDEVVEVINDVATRTNILALNASIEAARAGEAGEGFAVVANEVKALAEQTQDQAARIEETTEQIQETTTSTVESLDDTDDRILDGIDTIQSSMEILDDINAAVQETVAGIEEVANATDDQAASTEEMAAMVDRAASGAENIDERIEEVAASTEEQAAMVEDIEGAVARLNRAG